MTATEIRRIERRLMEVKRRTTVLIETIRMLEDEEIDEDFVYGSAKEIQERLDKVFELV